MSLHAIEPTRPRGQHRDDGVESPRHRADAATEARRVDGVGRPKFDFHTALNIDMKPKKNKATFCASADDFWVTAKNLRVSRLDGH